MAGARGTDLRRRRRQPRLAAAGAVFAASAVRTGWLGTAIVMHAAVNAATFVAVGMLS